MDNSKFFFQTTPQDQTIPFGFGTRVNTQTNNFIEHMDTTPDREYVDNSTQTCEYIDNVTETCEYVDNSTQTDDNNKKITINLNLNVTNEIVLTININ